RHGQPVGSRASRDDSYNPAHGRQGVASIKDLEGDRANSKQKGNGTCFKWPKRLAIQRRGMQERRPASRPAQQLA
ncbi:MAG: hypothetical protein Q9Q40_09895, partial [Acidobacteriota bacterium]|nr:hypothetical protein [Acidobacteriota bacterium]